MLTPLAPPALEPPPLEPPQFAPGLAALQATMAAALLDASDAPALLGQLAGPAERAAQGLAAYCNNVAGNWIHALRATYPVLAQLVGDAVFNGAARRYASAGRSVSGNLDDFGADFPAWLAIDPPAAQLPYLADVGRLEWAVQRAYQATDERPVAAADLADLGLGSLTADEQAALRLRIAAAVQLVTSPFPVADIWRAHQRQPVPAVAFPPGPHFALVSRDTHGIAVQAIDRASFMFIAALAAGQALGAALAATLQREPDTPPAQLLAACLQLGVLVGIRHACHE